MLFKTHFNGKISLPRPFGLTRAIPRKRVDTRANRTMRATCRTRERSSSCLLAYEVKLAIALTLLETEDYKNSVGTIDDFF